MKHRLSALAAVVAMAATACAQGGLLRYSDLPSDVDSGSLDNGTAIERVVFRARLGDAGASWLRLFFGKDTRLPAGSFLRLTALLDGDVGLFDARSLAAYGFMSGFFNGGLVTLELVAGPATRGNRVVMQRLRLGEPAARAESLCGLDNRVLSSDARVARMDGRCTAFLCGPNRALTAAHCVNGIAALLEFNVPRSTVLGQIVFAAQRDQYSLQIVQGLGGSTEDWSYGTVAPNAVTGLTIQQANGGQYFQFGAIPSDIAGQNIRITGYGVHAIGSLSQVQSTDVGPMYLNTSYSIYYRTDTTGGNSGSPVIHENTGLVIGIHLAGGCAGSASGNRGNRIDRPSLQYALSQNPPANRGDLAFFGRGCVNGSGQMFLLLSGLPDIGRVVTAQATQVTPSALAFLILGGSRRDWNGAFLPISLAPLGAPLCELGVRPDLVVAGSGAQLRTGFTVPLPNNPQLIGRYLFLQALVFDRGGFASSNSGELRIGG